MAQFWYNSTFHTALGCSPFKALYGYEAQLGTMLPVSDGEQSPAAQLLQDRENHLSLLKNHLAAAQNRMKIQEDHQRTDRQFQVGDQVLVKLQPYVQQSMVSRPYPKLAFKFYGAFSVLQRIGQAA